MTAENGAGSCQYYVFVQSVRGFESCWYTSVMQMFSPKFE